MGLSGERERESSDDTACIAMIFSVEDKAKSLGHIIEGIEEGLRLAFCQGVVEVAKGARDEWVRLAQARFKTSKEIYINGLRQAESFKVEDSSGGGLQATIQLVGVMPNNFEFGMGSFDMKTVRPGWLGGGKAKTAKDGSKYIVIPFRHSTGDTRFGYTGKAAGVRPDLKGQLKKVVKQYGLDRALTSSVGEVATRRIPRNAPVHPYLKGLQKTEYAQATRTGGMKRTGQLNTFRVMSENSPPESWIHPGLKPANLLKEVSAWVDKDMERMINFIFRGGR